MTVRREDNERAFAPADASARKALPLCSGVLDYFPDALLAVADVSKKGNDQHNPGQPLHWAKEKSADEADALVRHLVDRGKLDSDGVRHSAKVAWRALALLQREIDAENGVAVTPDPKWKPTYVPAATGNPVHDPLTHAAGECPLCDPTPSDLQAVREDIAELHKRMALGLPTRSVSP